MIRTEDLINDLAAEAGPPPSATGRLLAAVIVGAAIALIGLTMALGSPLQPVAERGLAASAIKLVYPLAIAIFGVAAALAAGRPGDTPARPLMAIGAAIALVAGIAAVEVSTGAPSERSAILFGSTFGRCVIAVALASLPVFAGLTWAFRLLAPPRPPLAGFLVGLASGGAGAAVYALYCPETTHAFLAGAYTPAMLIPAAAGALAGRKLLGW